MSRRIDLGDGMWMDFREDITMAEIEELMRTRQRFDATTRQYVNDDFHSSIEAVGVVVAEWSIDPPCAPTGDSLRALPAKLGMRIQKHVNEYLLELYDEANTGKSPDFGSGSESSPSSSAPKEGTT